MYRQYPNQNLYIHEPWISRPKYPSKQSGSINFRYFLNWPRNWENFGLVDKKWWQKYKTNPTAMCFEFILESFPTTASHDYSLFNIINSRWHRYMAPTQSVNKHWLWQIKLFAFLVVSHTIFNILQNSIECRCLS